MSERPAGELRPPSWVIPGTSKRAQLAGLGRKLSEMGVHTVCQSARCPNVGECFRRGTATFMILGDVCTRNCRFCAVAHGEPAPPDPEEARRVAEAAEMLGLRYVVVTSVTRDDLADGGASHFATTVRAIKERLPGAGVEVLTPDFQGSREALKRVLEVDPTVFSHNVETVPRLYSVVRPAASYGRSLRVLESAREISPGVLTKSGFMVGLGESSEEVLALLRALRGAGVAAVTIGQYLQPTRQHLAVVEYVRPEVFREYGCAAREVDFSQVLSGPLVRSSYHAAELAGR